MSNPRERVARPRPTLEVISGAVLPARACLHQLVDGWAASHPDAVAILAPGRTALTYGRLSRHVAQIVKTLNSLGVGRNDRVAMVLPEGPEMAVAFLGITAGATCAPLNPAGRASEFDFHLARLNCRALLVLSGSASPALTVARARGIPILELTPATDGEAGLFTLSQSTAGSLGPHNMKGGLAEPDDVAVALHTSGTGARPKLVPLTHRNICASALSIRTAVDLVESDRCLNVMPLFHIHGLSTLFASMAAGASVICTEAFSAPRFFEWMEAFRPTWYTAAPTIHRAILERAQHHPHILARRSLRFIRSASAAMPPQLLAEMERVFQVPCIEAYGMTEAGPQIASNRLARSRRKPGSVGPAAGPDVAVMDEAGNLAPPGVAGEIVVRGASVIPAYENDLEANGSAFVRGWLRTGDRGHLDSEGYLFVTGRLKEIINRGGEKISPREVEEVLLDHPAVAQAVAFPVPHPTLGEDIAAAIVLKPGTPAESRERVVSEVRRFAGERLAHFKVPQPVVVVDEIPRGPTGKVRRTKLASMLGLTTPGPQTGFIAPRTPVEQKVADLWVRVLGGDPPGVHDNFFRMGGDSLSASRVLSRLADELPVHLPAHSLFEHPTVAELAELVTRGMKRSGTPGATVIARRNPAEPSPLSFAQQRLWFLDQVEPGNPAYNMHDALRLSGKLCQESLERSLGEILRRHEALRTTFRTVSGRPVQVVSPVQPLRLPVVDLTRLTVPDRQAEALRLAAEEARRPFHLTHGPVFRVTLLKLDLEEHILLLTVHHIASDGWSTGVLHRELEALYGAFVAGLPSPLPEPPIQYGDFSIWQRQWLEGETLESQLAYWTRQLDGVAPVLELPTDRPRPAIQSHRGSRHSTHVSPRLHDALKALSRREGATPFMTLLAAFQVLLHRYTGLEDVVVGTPVANRTRLETEGLIGFFANTLVMRADLSGDPTFAGALRRVRETAIGACAHQDLPFERLVEALHPDRDHRHNPLFQVMFAFQNLPDGGPTAWPGLTVSPLDISGETAKFDLTLYLSDSGQGLSASWQYNTDLFDEARIVRMAGHFQTLLEGIVAEPDCRLSELPLLTGTERQLLLAAWNRTETPYAPEGCFHQLFEEQARATPDAAAVRSGDEQLTYRELNARANRLAWRLQAMGVGPETPVGILLERSAAMVVAVLAVMKAGGAYVPLDPSYPDEHLAFIRQDAGVAVLVTEETLRSKAGDAQVLCIDTDSQVGVVEHARNPVSGATPASLAYVIYTSGSTGKPKGVMITHANLTHYVHALGAALGIAAADRWLHTASFGFSSSVRQLAVPLSCGGCVVIAPPDTIRDPEALFELISRQGVSVVDLVPSYWRIFRRALAGRPAGANRVRLALSASEPLPAEEGKELRRAFGPGVRLINMFGQTETAGIVAVYPVPSDDVDSPAIVPVGRPIGNTRAYVLDASRQPVPVGVWGELYIGGAGVGRGYLNEPGLTAEAFVADPFSQTAGARLYRTGDVTRWMPDGNLEFSGRVDHQMKIHGYRIEPGQIEAVIAQHREWAESAVITREDAGGEQRLVAYVVPVSGSRAATRELRAFLMEKLPDYMIPSRIVTMVALPRTPNGKVNRSALAGPGADTQDGREPEHELRRPLTGAAAILTALWAELLGLDRVSPDDNFFDIGGNSILSIQMIQRANQAGLRLTPRQLWQHQTIAELAAVVGGQDGQLGQGARVHASEPQEHARVRVTVESLRAYGREALERAGLSPEGAAIVTEVQLEASLRDQPTHNMVSIPRYARRLANGTINPRPDIRIDRKAGISAHIDGDNGPGQWIAVLAMETAIGIARENGVGLVGVRGSNHLGAAGHYPWLAAREGLIGLCTTNGPVILAPTGGITPTFGNNPLGVGIPAGRYHPLLLDIAMSVAPRGRIGLTLAEGRPLPPGWILDRNGNPSTDPADLVAGLGVPIGGHKGYGLTLIMEVLAGVLTGANFGWDNRREHGPGIAKPANFGHFFMAIDPELFMASADFTARVDRLIEQTKSGVKAEGVEEILVPGESELSARERSLRDGVPLRPSTFAALRKYGRSVALETELVVVEGS